MTATRVIDDHIELANIGTKTHAEIEGHIQGLGNYAFPAADGNADQLLKTSGAGVLSWINQPAGFACGSLNACNITDIGTRAHASLTGIGTSDHHVKYLDSEAIAAMGVKGDANPLHHDKFTNQNAIDACDDSNKFIERGENNTLTDSLYLTTSSGADLLNLRGIKSGTTASCTFFKATAETTGATYLNTTFFSGFSMLGKGTDGVDQLLGVLRLKKNGGTQATYMDWILRTAGAGYAFPLEIHSDKLNIKVNLFNTVIKNGATQAGAGAAANEVWKTNGHATLPNNTLLIGV